MAAQKEKKLTEISCTFECLLTQNVYYISQNPKKEGFRELFLLFKTCSAVNFPKKHADFGGLETNPRHEI